MMQKAYGQLRIGNPLDQQNHVGPLIDRRAVEIYLKALEQIKIQGGNMLVEGGVIEGLIFQWMLCTAMYSGSKVRHEDCA